MTRFSPSANPLPVISVAALQESLAAGASHPCVLEVGWRARPGGDFDGIPGAIQLDTDTLETPGPAWRLRPLAELQSLLARLGLGADTPVVIVAGRAIAAARVWWVLRYLGVRDVRVLDGGSRAWRSAGSPAIDAFRPPRRVLPARARPALVARGPWLRAQLAVPGAIRLVDVRSPEEFAGERSGYSYLAARGR
ncbi:MAG: sulfurtransferase, partial [Gammaproteobacteria bacterium]